MQEALFDVPLYRQFAGLDIGADRLPEKGSLLRFRHLLEQHGLAARMFDAVGGVRASKGLMLKAGTAVDTTIIAAPSSTQNSTGGRDPEMHQTKKDNQWHFGMTSRRRRRPQGGPAQRDAVTSAARPHRWRISAWMPTRGWFTPSRRHLPVSEVDASYLHIAISD